jgi:hypothetical protein
MFDRGKVLRFDYPAANFEGVKPRLERRHLLVAAVRNPAEQPLSEEAVKENPLLKRDGELVTGLDLDKGQYRSFWSGSMVDVVEVQEYPAEFEVVLCESESSPEVVAKAATLHVALTWLQEWIKDPLGLIVGLRRTPKS